MGWIAGTPKLETLMLCRDDRTLQSFQSLVDVIGLAPQLCARADLAMEMIARWRFEAIFVDCDSVPEGLHVIRALRSSPSNRSSIVIALARQLSQADAFRAGATFVVDQDSLSKRTRAALRAAFGLMLLGRRRYNRRPLAVDAVLQTTSSEYRMRTVNLSESGVGLRTGTLPGMGERGMLEFDLPTGEHIRASVEVMWSKEGRAGVHFSCISPDAAAAIRSWVRESLNDENVVRMKVGSC